MAYELIFTSVPRGLKPGSRGFSTVAFTEGMPANYVQTCEGISGYTHAFPPQDPNYSKNPIAFSHYRFRLGGQTFSILSRVAAYGTDYSERSNKLAHHVMASDAERVTAGPAWAMTPSDFFLTDWKQEPHLIKTARQLHDIPVAGCQAEQWQRKTGDAGWAGVIAQRFLTAPDKPIFVIFKAGQDLLPLVAEVTSLLPPDKRWAFTFSTYFTALPQGTDCFLRCCLPTGEGLKMSRRAPDALILDLTDPKQPLTETGPLTEAARTGVMPAVELMSRVAYTPSPQVEESKPDACKLAQRKITVTYESNVPRAPTPATKQKNRSWFVPVVGVIAACLIIAIIGIFLVNRAKKYANFSINNPMTEHIITNSSPTNLIASNASNALQSSAKPAERVQPFMPIPSGTNKPTSVTATLPSTTSPKPLIDNDEPKMPGALGSGAMVKFISGSPIKETRLAATFCDVSTHCTLYDTNGKELKDTTPTRFGMGEKYKFKLADLGEIETDKKAGGFTANLLATNISLICLQNKSDKLYIVISPISLTRQKNNTYLVAADEILCRDLAANIKTATVTIALDHNRSICTNYSIQVVIERNRFDADFARSPLFATFLKSCPEEKKLEGIRDLQNSLSSNASVLACIPADAVTSNYFWTIVAGHITGLANVRANERDSNLSKILKANVTNDKNDEIIGPLRSFISNYNGELDGLIKAIRNNDRSNTQIHCSQRRRILQMYTAILDEISKDNKKKHLWPKVNNCLKFSRDVEKRYIDWEDILFKSMNKDLERRNQAAETGPNVELIQCECKIPDVLVLFWKK